MSRPARPTGLRLVLTAATAAALGAGLLVGAGTPAGAVTAPRTATAATSARAAAVPAAVRPGMSNSNVTRLQKLLGVQPASGWYGPATKAAVRKFKSSHGLGPGAMFGGRAWRVLLAEKGRSTPKASRSTGRTGLACPAPGASFGNDYGDPRSGHSHAGIDMMGRRGNALIAIEDGYVVRAGRQSNGANRMVIQGTKTGAKYYYGHNSSHLLSAGQRFQRGDVIARMGDSGSPGAVHLHFEWWKSGGESAQVNPYSLLRSIC